MAIARILPALLGVVAILATTAVLVIYAVLAYSITDTLSPVQISSILASALEALVSLLLARLLFSYSAARKPVRGRHGFGVCWLGLSLFLCVVACGASVVAIICLSNAHSAARTARIPVSASPGFLVGLSVTLGVSFAAQLVFLVVHYATSRNRSEETGYALETEEARRQTPPTKQVKCVLYHQTSFNLSKTRGSASMDSRTPPGSSGGRSAAETMSSIRTSLSHAVRPSSSKTRLLPGSQRSSRRQPSLDSSLYHERVSAAEDGFDSWDTSAVDAHNRQTVLDTSSPPVSTHFLETIPASPTTSRSPSPGTPLDLEPPRARQRSRSYSPAPQGTRGSQRAEFTLQSTASESHIHPLFRSDSPTPPPAATPGTMVTAAPNAGRVISGRQSVRSLNNRMRSGSLPVSRSPLSQQSSHDSLGTRDHRAKSYSPEPDSSNGDVESERKMTPPIPDWILSAGSRTSLSGYNSRRIKIGGSQEAETAARQV